MKNLTVADGKYTFTRPEYYIQVLRYAERWLTIEKGSRAIHALVSEATTLASLFRKHLQGTYDVLVPEDEFHETMMSQQRRIVAGSLVYYDSCGHMLAVLDNNLKERHHSFEKFKLTPTAAFEIIEYGTSLKFGELEMCGDLLLGGS